MRGLCSAPETSDSDLLEVLAMKWILDLAEVVDAQLELHVVKGEVDAECPDGVCRMFGLPSVQPLLDWRSGKAGLDEIAETFATDSPFRFLTGTQAFDGGEERHRLENLLSTCLLCGDTLLDSEVPLVLVRRLLVLEQENKDSAVTSDPSSLCPSVLEPVLEVVRKRREAGVIGPDGGHSGEGRTPQQEVDRQRKNLKPLFALAWFGACDLLGPRLAGEIGKCALDRAMRSSDPALTSEYIREAKARGEDDAAIRAILDGVEPEREDDGDEVERSVEEDEKGRSEVEHGGVLVPVGLAVSILEQMGLTAEKCPQRFSSFETTACMRCLLGRRCPSKARSVVTRDVGDWLVDFTEGAMDIAQHHRTAERFRIWLEPVGPGGPRTGLKRTFASGSSYREPPRKSRAHRAVSKDAGR
jgi:hypothetical protein